MPAAAEVLDAPPQVYRERIGDMEWLLEEQFLDVFDEVKLWVGNPRLRAVIPAGELPDEVKLEALLQKEGGYASLSKSIKELGQMEPIYVWRPNPDSKYQVIEGATRVTVLRDRDRKDTAKTGRFRRVRAKVLPAHFGKTQRAILLAKIHVRGPLVRQWGRYEQAQFVYETTEGTNTEPPLLSATQLALQMGKSTGWVTRLRAAYEFAHKFVEHVDADDAQKMAGDNFSILEEISRVPKLGPMLRDYDNSAYDELRSEVFEMVQKDVFKEYRWARFLKDFHDDPDKWAQLKSGEKHIAEKLAFELKANSSSIKAKIAGLEKQVERALERNADELDEEDAETFQRCSALIQDRVHAGIPKFKLELKRMTHALNAASKADILALSQNELEEFANAQEYFQTIVTLSQKSAS